MTFRRTEINKPGIQFQMFPHVCYQAVSNVHRNICHNLFRYMMEGKDDAFLPMWYIILLPTCEGKKKKKKTSAGSALLMKAPSHRNSYLKLNTASPVRFFIQFHDTNMWKRWIQNNLFCRYLCRFEDVGWTHSTTQKCSCFFMWPDVR